MSDVNTVISVYLRRGSYKIIMLLKPVLKEVVYTKLGLNIINVQDTSLPSYEQACHIASDPKFVLIPYKKGRTEDEVKTIISGIIVPTPTICDLRLDLQPYTGIYGTLNQLDNPMLRLLPNQTQTTITISVSPFGSYSYNRFASEVTESSDGIAILTEELMSNEGIIRPALIISNTWYDDVYEDIKQLRKVYYIVGVSSYQSDAYADVKTPFSHAMVLLLDLDTKTIEIFDPNGYSNHTWQFYKWVDKLNEYLNERKIYLSIESTKNEPFCPQGLCLYAKTIKMSSSALCLRFIIYGYVIITQ